jgi:sterol desaturase/sphingolipid hydroxylase (fatty acid hydroxylase superfamily)
MRWIEKTQFALFRIIIGIYLTGHFLTVLPDSKELFSNQGIFKDVTQLPTYGKMPVIFFYDDSPTTVYLLFASLIIASISLTFGYYRRICSLFIYYGWVCLLNRNPFISNPSMAYVGWVLLAMTLIESGERLGFLNKDKEKQPWQISDTIYFGAWIIFPLSYTASGIHKLQCPSWLDGTALEHVLTSLLARHNNPIVNLMLAMPPIVLESMTWLSLFAEITFLFLGAFYHLRKWYWLFMLFFHIGILTMVNFSDLTLGVIVTHLFLFDASWFECTKNWVRKYDKPDLPGKKKSDPKPPRDQSVPEPDKLKAQNDKESFLVWLQGAIIMSALVIGFAMYVNDHPNIYSAVSRINQLSIDALWGFGIIVAGCGFLMALERIIPDQKLPYVEGWWIWVAAINAFQLFAVVLATFTWEKWLQQTSYFTSTTGFHLRDYVCPPVAGYIAYIINQWLFYHWHKLRHEVYPLWIIFHQFHHSPQRIETVTSFYKHPAEIIADSQIMAVLVYSVLGLTPEASIWLSIYSAFGEYFYHMNIKTPQWIGYFFQRPESHRCHHRKNKRLDCPNMSDFPIWDILGRTFENPKEMNDPTGFSPEREAKRVEMLMFKDVLWPTSNKNLLVSVLSYLLVFWGMANSIAFLAHSNIAKDIGFATVSSPLPLVFSSFKGVETFSTEFQTKVELTNGTVFERPLDLDAYSMFKGSYPKRNVYGAVFSHGPFFDDPKMINLRQQVLHYAICKPGIMIRQVLGNINVKSLNVTVTSKTRNNTGKWYLNINC